MLAWCKASVNAVMNPRRAALLPRAETSTTQASGRVPTDRSHDALAALLDLRRYPFRVLGQALVERGILPGDVLIADTSRPVHPSSVVARAGRPAGMVSA